MYLKSVPVFLDHPVGLYIVYYISGWLLQKHKITNKQISKMMNIIFYEMQKLLYGNSRGFPYRETSGDVAYNNYLNNSEE